MEEQDIREQIKLKYECEGGYERIFGNPLLKKIRKI